MLRCVICHRRLLSAPCPRDGWTPQATTSSIEDDRPPEVAGYRVGAPIGAGGFSVVWEATRSRDGSAAALKVGRTSAPVLIERFRREADALEAIGPPHVPALYERGRLASDQPYLAMERLFGGTLAEWIARRPEPPETTRVTTIAGAILAALEAAHARGFVHRDLKPENIFLASGGEQVTLLDFGLVRRPDGGDAELTRSGVAVGTPEYMAPEQLRGSRDAGAPADIYAFGVILFELLTLQLPFAGDPSAIEHGHITLRPPRPSELAPVPPALDELVLACLAKEPERRPGGLAALRSRLAEAHGAPGPAPGARPETADAPRLVTQGAQPVVIAAIESEGDAGAIIATVTRSGGFVARQRGRRYVAVFSGVSAEDPARAALAAARALVDAQGARAALHLASATLRRSTAGALSARGAAIERPETWMPAEGWAGVHMTPELAESLGDTAPPAPAPDDAGRQDGRITEDHATERRIDAPLIGREPLLAALSGSARVAFEERWPALFTLIGEHGLGRSRIAAEAALLARRQRPEPTVVVLRAQAAAGAAGFGPADDLRRMLLEPLDGQAGARELTRALASALQRRARAGPLAIILDDAHWAEGEVLDALELATLDSDDACPLWVVVTAHPRFDRVRPRWGERTRYRDRATMEPLDEASAAALAAELLRPAEYPPKALLERLARWSGGNPASLSEVVRALKRAGIVRRRPGTSSFYVTTAELDALPASPVGQWLAARRLDALPKELAACARLCAALGVAFSREELERVEEALERAGRSGTPVDLGVGLRALVEEGLLAAGEGGRYAFQSAALRDAIYELTDPDQRAEMHRAAFEYWRARAEGGGTPAEALESLARHAAACQADGEAADAHLRLGDLEFARHRHLAADERYTAALAALPEGDARRHANALAGRGRCRYRIGRAREACDDLVAARKVAEALGDAALVAGLLLEEATALDWARDFEASAQRAEQARQIIEGLGSPQLEVRLLVAEGRTLWRRSQTAESIAILEQALERAAVAGDHESQVIALLMLCFQLAAAGRLDEAEVRFDEVIRKTMEAEDWPHHTSALLNRTILWGARREPARGMEDIRRAIALAREIGDPMSERLGTGNGVVLLYRSGRHDEALALARRLCMLEDRFLDRPTAWGRLLLARILLMLDRYAEAADVVADVEQTAPRDLTEASEMARSLQASFRMLKLVAAELDQSHARGADIKGGWDELTLFAEQHLKADEVVEIHYWRARMALRGGCAEDAALALDRAKQWAGGSPAWVARFAELELRPDAELRE